MLSTDDLLFFVFYRLAFTMTLKTVLFMSVRFTMSPNYVYKQPKPCVFFPHALMLELIILHKLLMDYIISLQNIPATK